MPLPIPQHTRECPYCKNMAQFTLEKRQDSGQELFSQSNASLNPRVPGSTFSPQQIAVFRCCVCHSPVFMRAFGKALDEINIYPSNIIEIPPEVPNKVGIIYKEALLCCSVMAWNATATMCRRAIQECVLDKGGVGNDLYHQIDDLYDKRIITDDIKAWAHEIRVLGRNGAHADVPTDVGEEEAIFAVDFVKETLNYIYVLKARLDQRKARKKT